MAKKIYDAVATVGEYTDKTGETKKRYMNVGAVFEHDGGGLSMKLEALPLVAEWSGWISFFVPKEREAQKEQEQKPSRHEKAKANAFKAEDFDDDIPF